MGGELAMDLELHVRRLAGDIGERHVRRPEALERAALYVERTWAGMGCEVRREEFSVEGEPARNLLWETRRPGPGEPFLVVGAHYDSVGGSPGADDNASGVAVLLELSRLLRRTPPSVPVRLAAFSCEEIGLLGSAFHAGRCRRAGENVAGMLSLEMLGYYDDRPGSQSYPPLLRRLYPSSGDFIGLVSDFPSRAFLGRLAAGLARAGVRFERAALPRFLYWIGLSDHASFWREGYPGAMLTDTAMFRNPHYHRPSDAPETLDYGRMAAIAEALAGILTAWEAA